MSLKFSLPIWRITFCAPETTNRVVQLIIQLVQLLGEFSPTFSLLKIAYLIHFKLKSYYLSKLSYFYLGHHFSLQSYMRWRETQNPNGFFLLPSSVVCWSSAKEVSTLNPRSLSNSRLGYALLSFPWMCVLASKKHARHGNHVEHKRIFWCIWINIWMRAVSILNWNIPV